MSGAPSIAGVSPTETVAPRDRADFAATVRELARAGKTFAFAGGGTQLELGNAPRALDVLVRTSGLGRVLDYSPEDQTITVEAGMTLAALDRILAEHAQMLPIESVDRTVSTVGGAIAVNAFGARRHRYGSIKDLIVGVELVRPDGTVAHGGGRVVKNVAGFDLPKLMVGSLGTLGAIVAATFRVFPQPRARAAVVVRGVAGALVERLAREQFEASSIVSLGTEEQATTLVTFEGDDAGVTAQAQRLVAGGAALAATGEIERVASAEGAVRRAGAWRVHATTSPAALAARRSADDPWLRAAVSYPSLGVALAAGDDRGDALADVAASIRDLRSSNAGHVVFHAMPVRWRGTVDAWGAPPPSLALMQALKAKFDPDGRCNPGRFVGGI